MVVFLTTPTHPRRSPGVGARALRRAAALALVLTTAVVAAVAPASAATTERVPVLMYHRITCPADDALLPALWICPSRFGRHMRALSEAGWRTMTARAVMASIRSGRPIPAKTFVITIDDGMRDGYDAALPILRRYGFVATYAVVVGRVGGRRSMSWAELREMTADGHEIASHTMDHDDLRWESAAGLRYEIGRSADILETRLGVRTSTFVYPYGTYDKAAVDTVRETGYRVAFTTAWGCTLSLGDRLLEERVRINGSDSPSAVLGKVRGC